MGKRLDIMDLFCDIRGHTMENPKIELIRGNALDVLRQDIGMFDAVITDPPYASGATLSSKQSPTSIKYTKTKRACPFPDFCGDSMDQRSWMHHMREILEAARDKTTPGAVLASFIDWRNLPALTDAVQWAGWSMRGVAVWDKMSSRPQRGRFRQQAEFLVWASNGHLPAGRDVPCLPGVFRAVNVQGSARIHQTQKPIEIMREIVRITEPGGRILDPFAGAGSTLEAARLEGYDALGIEIHEDIANAAAERLKIDACRAQA